MKKKEVDATLVERVAGFLESNGAGSVIKRSKVAKYSCDFLHPGTCRNDDSLGRGPDERVLFGAKRAVGYPLKSLARYMVHRGFVFEKHQVSQQLPSEMVSNTQKENYHGKG